MDAFHMYTPLDPEAKDNIASGAIALVHESAPDLKKKPQRVERLGERA